MVGKTNLTCPSFSDPFRCNVQESKYGEWFDLSKISPDIEMKFTLPIGNVSKKVDLIFHICRSMLSTTFSHCPPKSEVCIRISDQAPVEFER